MIDLRRLLPFKKRTALVMLTHTDDPRVVAHFARLKATSGLPTFRVKNLGPAPVTATSADITITDAELRNALPRRFAAMKASKGARIDRGFVDILEVAVMIHSKLRAFDMLWMIEADVDFAGTWRDFFCRYETSAADLLTFRIRTKEEMPTWIQWKFLRTPPNVDLLTAFMPVSRMSRRFLERYRVDVEKPHWSGHFEATIPTLAKSHGFLIEDIGEGGNFHVDRGGAPLTHESFGYRPVRANAYFHEQPLLFTSPGLLYHPVKVGQAAAVAPPPPFTDDAEQTETNLSPPAPSS